MPYWNCPQCKSVNLVYKSKCYKCNCFRSKAIIREPQRKIVEGSSQAHDILLIIRLLIAIYLLYNWFVNIIILVVAGLFITVIYNNYTYIQDRVRTAYGNICHYYRLIRNKLSFKQNNAVIDNDSDQQNSTCIICFDKEINTVITNCGHMGYCYECATNMNSCPVCRVIYDPNINLIKVFKV